MLISVHPFRCQLKLLPVEGVTIESHFESVTKAVSKRHAPELASHSQLFISEKHTSWNDLLSTVLLRKYVDVAVDPKEQFLRRRLDIDTSKIFTETSREIINPSKNAVDKAMFLCDEEFKKFNGEPMIEETGL